MKRILAVVSLLMTVNICFAADDKQKLRYAMQYACDSFKQEMNFNSSYVEFESCSFRETPDVIPNPLELRYKVKGEFAALVEQQLYERYQLPKFVKQESVALWETRIHYWIPDSDYIVDIGFVSDWTQIQKRENWHKIPYFYLWFAKQETP